MSKKSPKTAANTSPAAAPASDSRRGLFITAGALAFAAVASGAWLWSRGSGTDASARHPALASTHSPSLGSASAKVHVVEFLDPACETCAAFYPLVKQLMAEHPDRIRLSLRHVAFHKGSEPVVAMLEASRRQDRYWQVLEALLGAQGLWVDHHVVQPQMARQVVATLGLDMARLEADMQSPEVLQRIAQDRQDAATLNVTKTPEYFVNGRQMQSFGRQQLQELVRDAVQRAY